MRKIMSLCILISLFLWYYTQVNASNNDDNYFIVTAYYSPLPNQEYYITGNYEDELILNWKGIAGASWKWVFSWMLAAPGKYSFGTKIYLDGLGIWSVEDRWGAIVPAWERGYSYDRIDVWMGYWDEWLLRANFWGKRKVYGYVVDNWNTTSLNYKDVPAVKWATTGLQKTGMQWNVPVQKLSTSGSDSIESTSSEKLPDVFDISLWKWSDSAAISKMQEVLIELSHLSENTWEYDTNTISAVYNFQIQNNIIKNEQDVGAGFYGPKTRKKLKKAYTQYIEEKEKKEKLIAEIKDIKEQTQNKAQQYIESLNGPKYGEVSYEVRELQKILSELWYFSQKDTAIFWDITKKSIESYQLNSGIIDNINQLWTWVFGPKTQKKVAIDLSELYFQNHLKNNNLIDIYEELKNNDLI